MHTTNFFDTFIEVAEDTKAVKGIPPPFKNDKMTIAGMQYDLIAKNPYAFTSDDIIFQVYADRNGLAEAEYKSAREQFFSKGQPCFRTSPLTKNYGFGIHSNEEGKVALYGMETSRYQQLLGDAKTRKVKAMRSSKK